ncbi:hypothetical protein B0H13DRAFT_2551373, partial [Mycena leptocephala]
FGTASAIVIRRNCGCSYRGTVPSQRDNSGRCGESPRRLPRRSHRHDLCTEVSVPGSGPRFWAGRCYCPSHRRHWSSRDIGRHLICFLDFILPSAMTYRPIVAIVRGMVPFTQANKGFRASPFFEDWTTLLELMEQRVQLLNRFESPEYRPTRVCSECQAVTSEIRRCSGCLSSHYCSLECQTSSWRGGHREMCIDRRAEYDLGPPAHLGLFPSRRDESFLRLIVHHDYLANKLQILLQQLAFFHRTRSRSFVTVFNYTRGHCTVSVEVLADMVDENVVQSLPSILRRGLLHHLVLDVGSPTHSLMIRRALLLHDSSLVLVDGVVRIAGLLPEGADVSQLRELWPDLFEEVRMLSKMQIEETHSRDAGFMFVPNYK